MPTCDGPEEKHFTVGGYAGRLGMFVNTAMIVVNIPEGSVCYGTGIPLGVAVTGINFQRVRSQNDLKDALQRVPPDHDRIVVSCQLAGQSWDNEEQRAWWRGVVGTAESEEQAAARLAAEAAAGGGGGGDDDDEDSDGGYDPQTQVIDYAKAKKAAEAAASAGGWRGGGGADEDADEYQPDADPNYISFEGGGGGGGGDAAKRRPKKGYAGYSGFDNEKVGSGGYEEEDESYVRRRPQPHIVPAGVPVVSAAAAVTAVAPASSGLHPCPVSGPSCGRSAEQCWAGSLPDSTCVPFLVASRCPGGDACALLHAKPTTLRQPQGAVPLPHTCEECGLSMQRAGDLSSHLLSNAHATVAAKASRGSSLHQKAMRSLAVSNVEQFVKKNALRYARGGGGAGGGGHPRLPGGDRERDYRRGGGGGGGGGGGAPGRPWRSTPNAAPCRDPWGRG